HRRQPATVEPNLGQSRTQLAAAGDLQAGDAVRAQSRLKVLGFTKYRRAAARHSASTPMPEAVPAQPEGSPAIQALRKKQFPAIQFRQGFGLLPSHSLVRACASGRAEISHSMFFGMSSLILPHSCVIIFIAMTVADRDR